MKYSVNAGSIPSFVKIVNFVGEPTSERGPPVAVIKHWIENTRKTLKSKKGLDGAAEFKS